VPLVHVHDLGHYWWPAARTAQGTSGPLANLPAMLTGQSKADILIAFMI